MKFQCCFTYYENDDERGEHNSASVKWLKYIQRRLAYAKFLISSIEVDQ